MIDKQLLSESVGESMVVLFVVWAILFALLTALYYSNKYFQTRVKVEDCKGKVCDPCLCSAPKVQIGQRVLCACGGEVDCG